MKKQLKALYVLKTLAITAVFNTLIALFLTAVGFRGGPFVTNFIFSQCIGLSICMTILVVYHLFRPKHPALELLALAGALVFGSLVGIAAGAAASGLGLAAIADESLFFLRLVFFGLLFGAVVSYFFISRERMADSQSRMQEERIQRLVSEKRSVETHLRMLQAQIEPHFLFNTLSNVLSLMDTESGKAKSMLEDLICYLRTSLSSSRKTNSTVQEELDLIQAYMNIFKIRMGERLQFNILASESVRSLTFPPMMIQPLVENAIQHGLEPKIEGGRIDIAVGQEANLIRVAVADTGVGLTATSHSGLGIDNIRKRLAALYNGRGRLLLEENAPCGLKAVLEVPHVSG